MRIQVFSQTKNVAPLSLYKNTLPTNNMRDLDSVQFGQELHGAVLPKLPLDPKPTDQIFPLQIYLFLKILNSEKF